MKLHTESLDILVCQDFKSRLFGLIKSQPLGPRSSVWLYKCQCVHTFGMREPLSLIFLNERMEIADSDLCARPNRVYGAFKAHSVIEMAQKTEAAFNKIHQEIELLRRDLDVVEYFNKRRIKARVQHTAKQDVKW